MLQSECGKEGKNMKERSVLFTKELRDKVRSGGKTQTRRVILPQPPQEFCVGDVAAVCNNEGLWAISRSKFSKDGSGCWPVDPKPGIKPRYEVGDHLWMLEPYQIQTIEQGVAMGDYIDDLKRFDVFVTAAEYKLWSNRKRPHWNTSSRFMYKSLARTWFEVTDVRVERLKDMTEGDAIAEGITAPPMIRSKEAVEQLWMDWQRLWDSTSKIKWADNPWVFAYEFKLIDRRVM